MRITSGPARRRRRNRILKEARGFVGGRRKLIRTASEAVIRSRAYAYRDRKVRKRDFRRLWITRLTAACKMRGMSYSRFIFGLGKAEIQLNRKVLSELAINEPAVFDEVFALVEAAVK